MTIEHQVAMSDGDIHDFLAERQTAVMALAGDARPYAVPITYRFSPDEEIFYFRLVYPRGSEKRQFLPDVPESWLVAYEEADPVYASVVAKGQPVEIDEASLTPERVAQLGETSRPMFEMWSSERADLDIRPYELEARELTGRRIDTSER